MYKIKIESDFVDYYDILSSNDSDIVYKRVHKDREQRAKDLKFLRNLGLKTLELKQVNQFIRDNEPIVVYTNPKGHDGSGKEIMSVDDALKIHGNCTASRYIKPDNGYSLKYLQIGKQRFALYFRKDENDISLKMGELINIVKAEPEYNRLIGLPIYSIDYIPYKGEMIATDFNCVENLKRLGMNSIISDTEVISEIARSLIVYNRI